MKAVVYHEKTHIGVEDVEEPKMLAPTDAIVKVTSSAICGSDLHLYGGLLPGMKDGDILGHEFVGEVVEVGSEVGNVRVGERVLSPFVIACGDCYFCKAGMTALCDETNPNKELVEKMYGHSPAGFFGYTHLFGGYPGGQAQFVRVPHANVGLFKIPDELSDDQVLFLTDVFPTGYMAVEECNPERGDTVAIWGGGAVGQFAAKSAELLGARQIIMIDPEQDRLNMAKENANATPINYDDDEDVLQHLKDLTQGHGPDICVDAVGMEAHGHGIEGAYDKAKQMAKLQQDRPTAIRQVVKACRKGGIVSIPGVYSGFVDKFPLGSIFGKDLKLRAGQTHVHKYIEPLMSLVSEQMIDPSFVITHKIDIDDAPSAYEMFRKKEDGCIKVVMKPNG